MYHLDGPHVFLPSLFLLTVVYHLIAPKYTSSKQLSWILTTVSSAIMTTASMPFIWHYAAHGGSVKHVPTNIPLALSVNRFFQAYLTADLIMGALYYHDQVAILTGWIHHFAYILIVEYAIRRSWAHIFCLCAAMELPTFILSFTILNPRFRSNVVFAVAFFLTRILLHVILCISYVLPNNRKQVIGGSYLPSAILTAVFPLHAMWFHGCIQGFVRRARPKTAPASLDVTPVVDTPPLPPPLAIDPLPEWDPSTTTTTSTVITVPGSFSLPAVKLRLSVHRASLKRGWRSVRGYSSSPGMGKPMGMPVAR